MKKRILLIVLSAFVLLNMSAGFHAYTFTHFSSKVHPKSKAEGLGFVEKAGILFRGISNPRPVNLFKPDTPYQSIQIKAEAKPWKPGKFQLIQIKRRKYYSKTYT